MTKTMSISDAKTYARLFPSAAADRFFKKCMGQDAAMDDETVEKLKAFLQSKLRPEDHAAACALMDGGEESPPDNGEAQDTEPPPDDVELPKNATVRLGGAAADAQADFHRRYPGLAKVRIDNSGIQPKRAAGHSNTASFNERYPGLAHIKSA